MHLVLLLYVDDAALCFTSYREMTRGVSIIEMQMRHFGLILHVGTQTVDSKLEFMYVPSIKRTRQIVNQYMQCKRIILPQDEAQNDQQVCELRKKTNIGQNER